MRYLLYTAIAVLSAVTSPIHAESLYPPQRNPDTVADIEDPWLRPGHLRSWTGDLDEMMARGFVRVLTVANKTHFFVDGARSRGIVADMATALEAHINAKLSKRDAVRVVVIPVRRDQLLPMLGNGMGDIAMGNLTVTPARRELVDFTTPLIDDVREVVVSWPGASPIRSLEDLAGREIWVRGSSSFNESLQEWNRRLTEDGLRPMDIREADENLQDSDILEMVQAALYPATVVDSHQLDWVWGKVFGDLVVSDLALRDKGTIAGAFRKDSPQLEALLTEFLANRRVGTSFGDKLVSRYVTRSRWLRNANATQERQRFDAVVDFFRKYADQYDFDYLMLIAQGYQESRLDQAARSPVGAIGIMQLMPETAAGHPLYFDSVDTPEPNIHAGVKYMRYLVDNYFDDPALDPVNRTLMAFAAYNAGPNRVARLRKTAPEYGLDPNVWFKNVEHVVASKVGQEPVLYVANIFKYYLAYRRVRTLEAERAKPGAAPVR